MDGIQIKLRSEDAVYYVPDFRDNREAAAEGKPHFSVDLTPMSGSDFDKSHREHIGGGKSKTDAAIIRRAQKFVKRIVTEHVVMVRGFQAIGSNGDVIQPKNGTQLYDVLMQADASAAALIDELYNAIKGGSALEDGDLGKLRQQYGTSTPDESPSENGLASSVLGTISIPTIQSKPNLSNASDSESKQDQHVTVTPTEIRPSIASGTRS